MYVDKTEAERYGYETYARTRRKMNGRFGNDGFRCGSCILYQLLVVYFSSEFPDSDGLNFLLIM